MLGHTGAIMCMDAQRHAEDGTVLSRSSTLFTGSVDHHVGMWDLESGDDCMLIACGLHADCMLMASLIRWDLVSGTRLACLEGHSRSVHCLTLGHRGGPAHDGASVLFTGSRDHSIRVWDLRTGRTQHVLEGHSGSVTCLGTDGWRLISGGG